MENDFVIVSTYNFKTISAWFSYKCLVILILENRPFIDRYVIVDEYCKRYSHLSSIPNNKFADTKLKSA